MSYNESDMFRPCKQTLLVSFIQGLSVSKIWSGLLLAIIFAHRNCQYSHLYPLNDIVSLVGLTKQKIASLGNQVW